MNKKFYISIIVGLLAITLSSCEEWLDVEREGTPSESTYLYTDKDATDAMNLAYWALNREATFGRNLFWEQVASDDFVFGRSRGAEYNNMVNFTYNGRESFLSNSSLSGANDEINACIARTNWIITNLLKKANTELQKQRLGEAYFMRAFTHFLIAYRYGRIDQGVPFDRYEDYDPYEYNIPQQRATVMENYDLIIQDLQRSADRLPFFEQYSEADYGRAHKAAAWALMVKVYAYWAQHDPSKWALIPPLVDKIEAEGHRGLLDNFTEVFKIANNWSKEYIFSVNSSGYNYAGSLFPGVVLENKGWGLYNGWGYFKPTLGLYEEFEEGDQRRKATILAYNDEFVFFGQTRKYYSTSDLETGFQLAKYMEPFSHGNIVNGVAVNDQISPNGDRPTTELNLPIIRHAEMVLFKAEALIMQGKGTEAARELNRLTKRAGLGEKYTNATMDNLKHERRCELAGEFTNRFMDLKRWKDWGKLGQPKYGRKHAKRDDPASTWTKVEIWPAATFKPERDIVMPYHPDDVTKSEGKLKQNPGY